MNFNYKNIVFVFFFFLLSGCNTSEELISSIKNKKGNVECLLAFADKQKCLVKRLSSSQLCSNFKNWENKKNVSKELYEATVQEIKFRNYKCETMNVVKASSKSNPTIRKTANSKLPICPSTGRKYNCFGTVISSKRKYIGEFKNDKFNGYGKYYHLANDKYKGYYYEGEWLNNKRHGVGTVIWPDGNKYVGEQKNGQLHGFGTYFSLAENKFKGDKYTGEYQNGKRHGKGTYLHANGNKYIGEYRNGKPNGLGTYYYLANDKFKGFVHSGQYLNGKRHGNGTFKYPNGDKYEGNYRNDKREGKGTYFHSNGNKYIGDFINGEYNGYGIFTFKNGKKYIGQFKNDKYDGEGILYKINGKTKEGIWKDNVFQYSKKIKLPEAKIASLLNQKSNEVISKSLPRCSNQNYKHLCTGSHKFSNGAIYNGGFKNNKFDGYGSLIWKDGAKYVGQFKSDFANGKGTMFWANGNKYVGQHKNGKANGKGIFTYANGDQYEGEHKNDKAHGYGTMKWKNGDKYFGEHANGKANGKGTFIYSNGSKYVGNHKNDVAYGQGTMVWSNGDKYVGEHKNDKGNGKGIYLWANGDKYVGQIKDDKPHGEGAFTFANGSILKGVFKNGEYVKGQKKPKSAAAVNSEEFNKIKRQAEELKRKLAALEAKKKNEQIKIYNDREKPTIKSSHKVNGANAKIIGTVTDNTEVVEILIDGEQIPFSKKGAFETELYIPRDGLSFKIVAFDKKGNQASKNIIIERDDIEHALGPSFDRLNPLEKKAFSNPDSIALIIGVADYEKTDANAIYADKDAQQFYDYATMKLGVPRTNIKELINQKADRVEIGLAIKDWINRTTKLGKTDIYIFFAGHGLASDDGKDMFLLPYDGSPRLLASAIKRKELFDDIKQANPRSVTVFLDTCYSGATRGTDMLISSRPINIRAIEQSIPNNFTVFSAAAGDQTSKPLEEAKHGMFSYFLMKGMEGDADANNDNKITARELHAYVEQNVVQQSSGSQTPELQGDKERVLVQFN